MANTLTVSGNEITDATRLAALSWGTAQSGGSVDDFTWPNGSYNVFESGTNLFRRGQCDATTDYNTLGAGVTIAIDAGVKGQFSSQSIAVTTTGSNGSGVQPQTNSGLALAVGTTCSGSIWFLGTAGQSYGVGAYLVNTDASTTASAGNIIFNAIGSWQELRSPTVNVAAGKIGDRIRLEVFVNSARSETFHIAHPMIQSTVKVVSPYIATTAGATAARAAGRVQAPSTLLNKTQGWFAAYITPFWPSTLDIYSGGDPRLFNWNDGSNNNLLDIRYNFATGGWQTGRTIAGVTTFARKTAAWATLGNVLVVGAWDAAGVHVSVNGSVDTFTAAATVPNLTSTTFDMGSGGAFATGRQLNGNINWAAGGFGTLTNTDYATLSALGTTTPLFNTLPNAALTTFIWPSDTIGFFSSIFGGFPLRALEPSYKLKALEPTYGPMKSLEPTYKSLSLEPSYTVTGVDIEY